MVNTSRLNPIRRYYGMIVTLINASKLVFEGEIFGRVPHVPVTHIGYFNPPVDSLLTHLTVNDLRSVK